MRCAQCDCGAASRVWRSFAALKRKTGIPYERMCFFDDGAPANTFERETEPHCLSLAQAARVHARRLALTRQIRTTFPTWAALGSTAS
eukprot:1198977-Prymnesium_polylepis.1